MDLKLERNNKPAITDDDDPPTVNLSILSPSIEEEAGFFLIQLE